MEFSPKTKTVQSFVRDVKNGTINMHHKLQRQEGLWNTRAKAELIDSVLWPLPLDPIRVEKKDGKFYVFDGVQRGSTLVSFIADGFRLPKDFAAVKLHEQTYDIAGKKFSKLDEEVQQAILNYEVQLYVFTDCTEKDIREMYRRQNNGKPMSGTQKRTAIESDEVSEIVFSLAEHPFFKRTISPAKLKNDVARDYVREALMLTETSKEKDLDFTNFSKKSIDFFVLWYGGEFCPEKKDEDGYVLKGQHENHIDQAKVDSLREAMDKLLPAFPEDAKVNIPPTSLPVIIYAGGKVLRNKKSFSKFIEAVQNYNTNEDYKQFPTSSTTSPDVVRAKLAYWDNIIKNL